MNQVGVRGPPMRLDRTHLRTRTCSPEAVARRIGFLLASKGTAMVCVPDRALAYGRLMPISMQVSPYQFSKGTM